MCFSKLGNFFLCVFVCVCVGGGGGGSVVLDIRVFMWTMGIGVSPWSM